jgi:hypothetical protein
VKFKSRGGRHFFEHREGILSSIDDCGIFFAVAQYEEMLSAKIQF